MRACAGPCEKSSWGLVRFLLLVSVAEKPWPESVCYEHVCDNIGEAGVVKRK